MDNILIIHCPCCGYPTPFQYDLDEHIKKSHPEHDGNVQIPSSSRCSSSIKRESRPKSQAARQCSEAITPKISISGDSVISKTPGFGRSYRNGPTSDTSPGPWLHPADDAAGYVECLVKGCGEVVGVSDMDLHLDLHSQEDNDSDIELITTSSTPGNRPPISSRSSSATKPRSSDRRQQHLLHRSRSNRGSHHNSTDSGSSGRSSRSRIPSPSFLFSERQRKVISEWKNLFSHSSVMKTHGGVHPSTPSIASNSSHRTKRLGKDELGKYAHENKMPDWLVSLLQRGGQVRAKGMIPVIEQLLEQSAYLKTAYLCHPRTDHISKLRREGGFCGYRNMQILISYMLAARSQGHEHFKTGLPSVFELQDHIERAWDNGINSYGRIETGGVRGTRKFIGTPEAQAVFCNLGIRCDVRVFKDKDTANAVESLLAHVEAYFQSGVMDPKAKIHQTDLPPIYLQHRGHSLTIIGLEKQRVNHHTLTNLLVFDPMFADSSSLTRLVGAEFKHKEPNKALNAYRRRNEYLGRYHEFEVLK